MAPAATMAITAGMTARAAASCVCCYSCWRHAAGAIPGAGSDTKAAGPDFEAAGPDFEAAGPDFEAAGPDFEAAGPDSEAAGPDFEAAWPDFGPLSKSRSQ